MLWVICTGRSLMRLKTTSSGPKQLHHVYSWMLFGLQWAASVILSSKYGFVCRINIWELGTKIQKKVVGSWKRPTRATHRQCLVSMDTKGHEGSGVKHQVGLVYLVYSLILSRALFVSELDLQRQHGSHVASSIKVAPPCWHIGPRCCCFYYLWSLPDERDAETHPDCRRMSCQSERTGRALV